jgi:hypothetical protein
MLLFPNFGHSSHPNYWKIHFRLATTRSTNDGIDFYIPEEMRTLGTEYQISVNVKETIGGRRLGLLECSEVGIYLTASVNGVNVASDFIVNHVVKPLPQRTFHIKNPWYSLKGYTVNSVLVHGLRVESSVDVFSYNENALSPVRAYVTEQPSLIACLAEFECYYMLDSGLFLVDVEKEKELTKVHPVNHVYTDSEKTTLYWFNGDDMVSYMVPQL